MAESIDVHSDSTMQAIEDAARDIEALLRELQKIVVGQRSTLRGIITCMLAGGHALLEGVPLRHCQGCRPSCAVKVRVGSHEP